MIKTKVKPAVDATGSSPHNLPFSSLPYDACAMEAEQAVIGGLILANDKFITVTAILNAEDFYNSDNRLWFKAIESLHQAGKLFDLVTLTAHLPSLALTMNEGDAINNLARMANNTPSAANIEHYAQIVKDKANRRKLSTSFRKAQHNLQQGANLPTITAELQTCLNDVNISMAPTPNQLKSLDLAEFLALDLPPRELLLNPWLPKAGLCMIFAARGTGKTYLSFGIAYAVASGGEFLTWKADKARGVLLIDGEMPAVAAQDRWARLVTMNKYRPLPVTLKFVTPDIQACSMPDLATRDGQMVIERHLTAEIELLILDNLSCLVRTGKENDSESWQPVQTWALSLRARGVAVLFIHHAGKTGAQRGSSKKEDVLDSVISLKRPADYDASQGARFIVSYEKSRGFHGEDAKSFEAQLTQDQAGSPCWVTRSLEDCTYQKVVTLLNDGLTQSDIAKELEINKSTVSRHAAHAKNEGLLKKSGGRHE